MFLVDKYKNKLHNLTYYKNIIKNIIYHIDSAPHIINNINECNNTSIDNFITNNKKAIETIIYNRYDNFQHIILYGHHSISKDIILDYLLETIYGKNNIELKDVEYYINSYSNIKSKIMIKQSKYHIIIEPNSNGMDKYLIQDIIQEYAKTELLDILSNKKIYKSIVINKIDDLSYYTQASIRRTMEKYSDICKFILISDNLCKIIAPIRSRCIMHRIPLPTDLNILEILLYIIYNENIDITEKEIKLILKKSNNIVNIAIWYLEMNKYQIHYTNNWENHISDIVNLFLYEITSNKQLYKILKNIEDKFYQLFITNIPIQIILYKIMIYLFNYISDVKLKYKIIELTALYDQRLTEGTRYIIHIEAYIINMINLLSQFRRNVIKI